jgi:hypothetical protein
MITILDNPTAIRNKELNELADKWAVYLDEYFKKKGSHKYSLSLEAYIKKNRLKIK